MSSRKSILKHSSLEYTLLSDRYLKWESGSMELHIEWSPFKHCVEGPNTTENISQAMRFSTPMMIPSRLLLLGKILSQNVPSKSQGFWHGCKLCFQWCRLLRKPDKKCFVKVIGYCDEQDQQISIYEYMPGGTLHKHLHSKLPHWILCNAGIRNMLNIIFQDNTRSHEIWLFTQESFMWCARVYLTTHPWTQLQNHHFIRRFFMQTQG